VEAAGPEVPVTPLFVLRESGPAPLDGEELHPGEVVGLRIDWPEGAPGEAVALSAPGANLGQAVALRLVPEDPRAEGAMVVELLLLGLGEIELPSIPLRMADGTLVGTAPLALETVGALEEGDEEPAPAREQARIGLEPLGLAAAILALLLPVALLVAYLVWRRRRPALEAPPAPAAPPEPPEAWAHRSLDELLASELLARGLMKEFHVRLAEIAKEYLSRRYHLHLVERTTFECPGELRRAGVETALARQVGHWLEAIDLVKFAGEHPPSAQVVSAAQALREMIDRTTPSPEPPAAAAGASED
jgi:hypothetical protein